MIGFITHFMMKIGACLFFNKGMYCKFFKFPIIYYLQILLEEMKFIFFLEGGGGVFMCGKLKKKNLIIFTIKNVLHKILPDIKHKH